MKKLMFVFAAMLGSVAFVNAQAQEESNNAVQEPAATEQQDEKVKIKSEELPEAVQKALQTQDYSGWLVDAAYKHTATDTYEVSLKNGAETKVVKFDKDGKMIE